MTKVHPHLEKRPKRGDTETPPANILGANRLRMATTVAVLFITVGLALKVLNSADDINVGTGKVTACDHLAAHPADPNKLTVGVAQSDVDVPKAKAACLEAHAANPNDGRILYQLGRTYVYGQEFEKGVDYMRQSEAAGYSQGQFVLGLMYVQGYGIEPNACEGGKLWVKAARQPHINAKIYLINNWVDGMFTGCDLGTTDQELDGMVSAAEEMADTVDKRDEVALLRKNWNERKR